MTRRTRQVGTLVLTAAAIAYLVWKIELGTTLDVLADTNLAWFALAVAIMVLTVPVLALRWGWLLAAHGIHERVPWLTRAYFVAYTAGQVLPTSLGGDAVRVVETTRRHPGRGDGRHGNGRCSSAGSAARRRSRSARSASCSRSASTTSARTCGSRGSSSSGRSCSAFLFFARSARPLLRTDAAAARAAPARRAAAPLLRGRPPLPRPSGPAREGARGHASRVQAVRILAIWAAAKAVGIDLDPRIYYVFGPLLFLVMLVPFTLNGLAVREAFFVSFLGSVGVGANQAFAAGFLYFLVTLLLAFPGALIMLRDGLRGGARAEVEHG